MPGSVTPRTGGRRTPRAEPLGIVAGGDQQLPGGVDPAGPGSSRPGPRGSRCRCLPPRCVPPARSVRPRRPARHSPGSRPRIPGCSAAARSGRPPRPRAGPRWVSTPTVTGVAGAVMLWSCSPDRWVPRNAPRRLVDRSTSRHQAGETSSQTSHREHPTPGHRREILLHTLKAGLAARQPHDGHRGTGPTLHPGGTTRIRRSAEM